MRGWTFRCSLAILGFVLAVGGCTRGGTEPGEIRYHVRVHAGDLQYGALSTDLADPLEVVVTEEGTGKAAEGVLVRWTVVEGDDAELRGAVTETDHAGVASMGLRLGGSPGVVRVQATVDRIAGRPAEFVVHAIERPRIQSISTKAAKVGDTIVVRGAHFASDLGAAAVSFDGIHGEVISTTPSEIRVAVPSCLPSRRVAVVVLTHTVASDSVPLDVTGSDLAALAIRPGQVLEFGGAEASTCIRLSGEGSEGSAYLVVAQNVASSPRTRVPFELIRLVYDRPPQPPSTLAGLHHVGDADFPLRWEARLREIEARLPPSTLTAPQRISGAAAPPKIGETRRFKVYNREGKFSDVTAVVRHVGKHVALYEDVNAPAGGFSAEDFAEFGDLFDGPIYESVSEVFGSPSDLDGNGRVIILFTPVVNELTPHGSSSFVAGFFYACDLSSRRECSGSNEGEIFYSVVPDPRGSYGDIRHHMEVKDAIPAVLAHELQHMIHFNQRARLRGGSQEALWLSEGLAHAAENVVAAKLVEDAAMAAIFRRQNVIRARRFLFAPHQVTLVGDAPPGTIEERGAYWLFVEYLAGQFGGYTILGRLTQDTLDAIANVEDKTGTPWEELLGGFAVALYADDAPSLATNPPDQVYSFPHLNLRQLLGAGGSGYPLVPTNPGTRGAFRARDTLLGSSAAYFFIGVPASHPEPVHVQFAGKAGKPFKHGDPVRLSVLRIY